MKAIPQIKDPRFFVPQTRRELYAQCFDELIRQVSPQHMTLPIFQTFCSHFGCNDRCSLSRNHRGSKCDIVRILERFVIRKLGDKMRPVGRLPYL